MTWLTWRLHRTEAAIGLPLFAAVIVIMMLAIQSVDSAYNAARDGGCFGDSGGGALCNDLLRVHMDRSNAWSQLSTLLHGIPLAVAVLIAIPSLQELERGTFRLAWTQSISRRRWSLTRLGFVAGAALVVAGVWAVTATRWNGSVLRGNERTFAQDAFELSPAVLVGYGLFAVALGMAAAVVLRRVIPALAVLVVGFIGTRVFTTFVLRERYRDPVEETIPAADNPAPFAIGPDRWILDETWLSRTGERLSWERVYEQCSPASNDQTNQAYDQCLAENGLQYFRVYHPRDRFDQFQLIEMAIYLGLAAALFGFAYWWLTRRTA